jgi:hypothetical protein
MERQDRPDGSQANEQTRTGDYPEPGNPHGKVDTDRVETSSGTAPTGGVPVGSAADRIQPDRSRWTGSHADPNRPASSTDNVPGPSLDAVPTLGGVAGATPPLGVTSGSVHGTVSDGIAGVSPRTGMTSGAVMGDVGAGMSGEEEMDVDPDAD